jgi:hypothetical protein
MIENLQYVWIFYGFGPKYQSAREPEWKMRILKEAPQLVYPWAWLNTNKSNKISMVALNKVYK